MASSLVERWPLKGATAGGLRLRRRSRSSKTRIASAALTTKTTWNNVSRSQSGSSTFHQSCEPEAERLDVSTSSETPSFHDTAAYHERKQKARLTGKYHINNQLFHSESIDELLNLVDTYHRHFNDVNTTTAVMKLSKLVRNQPPGTIVRTKTDARVSRLLSCVAKWAPESSPKQLITMLCSLAWYRPLHASRALNSLLTSMEHAVSDFSPEDLCHAVWACAKLGFMHSGFLSAVERDALSRGWLNQLPPVSLANLLWGLAKLRVTSHELFRPALCYLAEEDLLQRCDMRHLSMIVWSYSTMRINFAEVAPLICARIIDMKDKLVPQSIANIVWGLSTFGGLKDPAPFLHVLTTQARLRLKEFKPKELSNLMGGLSRFQVDLDEAFVQDVLNYMRVNMHELCASDLSEWLVAMATMQLQVKEQLLEDVALACATKVPHCCPPQQLSLMLWSFAKMGHSPSPLLYALDVGHENGGLDFLEWSPKHLARLVWSLAAFSHKAGALMDAAADAFVEKMTAAEPQSVSMMVWSYATLEHAHHTLMEAVANHVCTHLSSFKPQGLANILWGYAKLKIHPNRGVPGGGPLSPDGRPVLDAIAHQVAQNVHLFDAGSLSMMVWSYAALEHFPGDHVMNKMAQRVVTGRMTFNPKGLVALSWGYAQLGGYNKAVFDIVAAQVMDCDWLEHYPTSALANIAFAFAKAGDCRPDMMQRILDASRGRLDDFSPPELVNLLWSCGNCGVQVERALLDVMAAQLFQRADEAHVSLHCLAVHSFALLQHNPGALLGATGRQIIENGDELSSSLLCTLLNAYAMLHYIPDDDVVEAIARELSIRMKLLEGREKVLTAREVVQAFWSLLLMDQSHLQCTAVLAAKISSFPCDVPSEMPTKYMLLQAVTMSKTLVPRLYALMRGNKHLVDMLDGLAGSDVPHSFHKMVSCRLVTPVQHCDGLAAGEAYGRPSSATWDMGSESGGYDSGGHRVASRALHGSPAIEVGSVEDAAVGSAAHDRERLAATGVGHLASRHGATDPERSALCNPAQWDFKKMALELRGVVEEVSDGEALLKKSVLGDWLVSFTWKGSKAVALMWGVDDVVRNSGGLLGHAVARYQVLEASGLLVFEILASEWRGCQSAEQKLQLVQELLVQDWE